MATKRRRHSPDQIIRKLAEGHRLLAVDQVINAGLGWFRTSDLSRVKRGLGANGIQAASPNGPMDTEIQRPDDSEIVQNEDAGPARERALPSM